MFTTGLFAMIFSLAWSFSYANDNGWLYLLGIFLVGVAASVAWIALITFLLLQLGRPNFRVGLIPEFWALGTIGVWVFAYFLFDKVSWFGLVN